MIEILLYSFLNFAKAGEKANTMSSADMTVILSDKCRAFDPRGANDFQLRNGIEIGAAVSYELSKAIGFNISNVESVNRLCASMLGKTYGRIKFTSSPEGADIYVDGDLQSLKTNSTFATDTGVYSYKIEIDKKNKCEGKVKVEANKLTTVPPCKG